jgi:hypothetical protein
MENLSKKEVIAELKKLGINSTSELNSYYKEYKRFSAKSSQAFFARILQRIRRQLLQQGNAPLTLSKEKTSHKKI